MVEVELHTDNIAALRDFLRISARNLRVNFFVTHFKPLVLLWIMSVFLLGIMSVFLL